MNKCITKRVFYVLLCTSFLIGCSNPGYNGTWDGQWDGYRVELMSNGKCNFYSDYMEYTDCTYTISGDSIEISPRNYKGKVNKYVGTIQDSKTIISDDDSVGNLTKR